ncbi:MAG: DUF5119 domain-containing protein [Bacteroidales bacterium]|nr:DUF5119 domain-containing protein [Bacteroidales bacterium]
MRQTLFLLLAGLMLVTVGCRRIPMYEPESGVFLKLNLDTKVQVEVDEDFDLDAHPSLREKVDGKMPETVRACFYDIESHQLVTEDFLPPMGGFVDVPVGVYDIVVYSLGTEVTQVESTQTRAGGYAFTSQTGNQVKQTTGAGSKSDWNEQPVIFEPDHLYGGHLASAVVPAQAVDGSLVVLEVDMTPVTEAWTLEICNVEGIEQLSNAEVFLTGQAAGRYQWDRRATNHPAALDLPLLADVSQGRLYIVFTTFGKFPVTSSDVIVNLQLTVAGGNRVRASFDVTDQFLDPDNTAHNIVINELIEVPQAGSDGGGFNPVVTDWGEEDIEVILG